MTTEQAIRYLILAAENAVGRFAYRDASRYCTMRTNLVLEAYPSLRAELRSASLSLWAMLISRLGALAQSAQTYAAAAARAQQAGLKKAQLTR